MKYLTLYHGTDKDFNTFDPNRKQLGFHFGATRDQAEDRIEGVPGRKVKEFIVRLNNPYDMGSDLGQWDDMEMLQEYFSTSNEGPIPNKLFKEGAIKTPADVVSFLKKKGFDGIVYYNAFEGYDKNNELAYVIFDPEQIIKQVNGPSPIKSIRPLKQKALRKKARKNIHAGINRG